MKPHKQEIPVRWIGLLLMLLLLVATGCTDSENGGTYSLTETVSALPLIPLDSAVFPDRGFFKGVLPIPADGQETDAAYLQASQYADFAPVWASGVGAVDWADFAEKISGPTGDLFVDELVRENGMFPLIHFSFIDQDSISGWLVPKIPQGMGDVTLSSPEFQDAYTQAVLDVVKAVRPLYLSVGNEVNRWYEQYGLNGPNGFSHFVSLYEEVYDAVKGISPRTMVFCTFAREMVSELRQADLSVLSLFAPEKLDMLVLTSYPHSVRKDADANMLDAPFNRPSDIPDDYYARVYDWIDMVGKPVGFSEVAWPSTEAFGGEAAQAEFLTSIVGRLSIDQGLALRLLGWPWLHDLAPGDDTGLIARDGAPKAAFEVWQEL